MYDIRDVGTYGQAYRNAPRQSQRINDSNPEENEIENHIF